jgi:hypothetical protein
MFPSVTMNKPNVPASPVSGSVVRLLQALRDRAEKAGAFGPVRLDSDIGRLTCRAANAAEPAEYRVDVQQGKLWVSLVTPNRWLSESIETDLLHTGDKLGELIEEELAEFDYDTKGETVTFEHFRSDDKLFTFRSTLPIRLDQADAPDAIETASKWLLAYEACFRRLGDMDGAGDEE